jgi:hypothetical protein
MASGFSSSFPRDIKETTNGTERNDSSSSGDLSGMRMSGCPDDETNGTRVRSIVDRLAELERERCALLLELLGLAPRGSSTATSSPRTSSSSLSVPRVSPDEPPAELLPPETPDERGVLDRAVAEVERQTNQGAARGTCKPIDKPAQWRRGTRERLRRDAEELREVLLEADRQEKRERSRATASLGPSPEELRRREEERAERERVLAESAKRPLELSPALARMWGPLS